MVYILVNGHLADAKLGSQIMTMKVNRKADEVQRQTTNATKQDTLLRPNRSNTEGKRYIDTGQERDASNCRRGINTVKEQEAGASVCMQFEPSSWIAVRDSNARKTDTAGMYEG
jgi:hypothetical protein